jgi:D-xylose transport system substrate-binding protein
MKRNLFFKSVFIILMCMAAVSVHAQKIGLLMDSYVTDRWYLDQKLFIDKVKSLGGDVQVEVAYGDPAEQLRLAKKLIADGAKVLAVVPVDGKQAVEIVKVAKAAKVPVLAYDRLIDTNDIDIYISYNNERIGELQAQYALSKVPQGNYLLINGPVIDNNAILYRKGQYKALQKSIDEGKVKIVGDMVQDDWGEIGALMKVDEFLSTSKVKPDAIVAANDALAGGAIQALPVDLAGKIVITGQDADLTALKYIVSGAQTMTIYKPIKPVAQLAGETAMQLAHGQKIPNTIKLKYAGIEVNAILLDAVVVDKTNYKETVVKDVHVSLSEIMDKK